MIRIEIPTSEFLNTDYLAISNPDGRVATGEVRVVLSEDDQTQVVVVFGQDKVAREYHHHRDLPGGGAVIRQEVGSYDDWQIMDDVRAAWVALGPLATLFPEPVFSEEETVTH
jgi:hypothetical protein